VRFRHFQVPWVEDLWERGDGGIGLSGEHGADITPTHSWVFRRKEGTGVSVLRLVRSQAVPSVKREGGEGEQLEVAVPEHAPVLEEEREKWRKQIIYLACESARARGG